jgi:hypothetical protein
LIPWLFHRYKYVGEKIAFGIPGGSLMDYHKRFFDFQKSFFLGSNYLCIFRRLYDVVISMLKMFPLYDTPQGIPITLYSIALSYWSIFNLYFSFQKVHILQHEKITEITFRRISSILDIDLESAYDLYDDFHQHDNHREKEFFEYKGYESLKKLNTAILCNIDTESLCFFNRKTALEHLAALNELLFLLRSAVPDDRK